MYNKIHACIGAVMLCMVGHACASTQKVTALYTLIPRGWMVQYRGAETVSKITEFGRALSTMQRIAKPQGMVVVGMHSFMHMHANNGHPECMALTDNEADEYARKHRGRIEHMEYFGGALPVSQMDDKHTLWLVNKMQEVHKNDAAACNMLLAAVLKQMTLRNIACSGAQCRRTNTCCECVESDNTRTNEEVAQAREISETAQRINQATARDVLAVLHRTSPLCTKAAAVQYFDELYSDLSVQTQKCIGSYMNAYWVSRSSRWVKGNGIDVRDRIDVLLDTKSLMTPAQIQDVISAKKKELSVRQVGDKTTRRDRVLLVDISKLYHMMGAWMVMNNNTEELDNPDTAQWLEYLYMQDIKSSVLNKYYGERNRNGSKNMRLRYTNEKLKDTREQK